MRLTRNAGSSASSRSRTLEDDRVNGALSPRTTSRTSLLETP